MRLDSHCYFNLVHGVLCSPRHQGWNRSLPSVAFNQDTCLRVNGRKSLRTPRLRLKCIQSAKFRIWTHQDFSPKWLIPTSDRFSHPLPTHVLKTGSATCCRCGVLRHSPGHRVTIDASSSRTQGKQAPSRSATTGTKQPRSFTAGVFVFQFGRLLMAQKELRPVSHCMSVVAASVCATQCRSNCTKTHPLCEWASSGLCLRRQSVFVFMFVVAVCFCFVSNVWFHRETRGNGLVLFPAGAEGDRSDDLKHDAKSHVGTTNSWQKRKLPSIRLTVTRSSTRAWLSFSSVGDTTASSFTVSPEPVELLVAAPQRAEQAYLLHVESAGIPEVQKRTHCTKTHFSSFHVLLREHKREHRWQTG